MTKNDLQNDLLADLQGAANARPLPVLPPPLPTTTSDQLRPPTPSMELRVTPLRWNRPALAAPGAGLGVGLKLGPVQVSLSLRS